jgi:dynactin-4
MTTLTQRLAQPEFQTVLVSDLFPAHKHLMIKRSQRCRSCEHNVSKPEFNPGSIKFKIQLAAYYHIPDIRVVTCEPLQVDKQSELIIKLCNPTQHQTTVQFLPLPFAEDDLEEKEKEIEKKINTEEKDAQKTSQGKDDVNILLPSLSRQMYISEDPRPVNVKLTGEVIIPSSSVVLPPRDDAAEYDDSGDTYHFQDDSKVVVWRKANKAAVKMVVIPQDTAVEAGGVLIGFVMKYAYVNTMATLEQKEPQKVDLKVKVFINVGKTPGSCN